ncbi:MAG: hypothetical protein AAFO82_14625, partial [Bacteroidota bacterium]
MYRYFAFLLPIFLLLNCQNEASSSDQSTDNKNSSIPAQSNVEEVNRNQERLNQLKAALRVEGTPENALSLATAYEAMQRQEVSN